MELIISVQIEDGKIVDTKVEQPEEVTEKKNRQSICGVFRRIQQEMVAIYEKEYRVSKKDRVKSY